MSSPRSVQIPLPPALVQSVNPGVNRSGAGAVKRVNPLAWVRGALVRSQLPQRWLAAVLDISEPLLSAQLSDHNTEKHLSLRRMGRIEDASFWKEFFLLGLEDLGFHVVVMDEAQYEAHQQLTASAVTYARSTSR
jgi:hypothetical protein